MYPTAFDSPLEWNGLFGTSSSNWFSCISIGIAEHGMFIEWKNKKRVKNNFHVYFIRKLQKLNSIEDNVKDIIATANESLNDKAYVRILHKLHNTFEHKSSPIHEKQFYIMDGSTLDVDYNDNDHDILKDPMVNF